MRGAGFGSTTALGDLLHAVDDDAVALGDARGDDAQPCGARAELDPPELHLVVRSHHADRVRPLHRHERLFGHYEHALTLRRSPLDRTCP
jgi:hypothetical protein